MRLAYVLMIAILLTACGGHGGQSSSPQSAPPPAVTSHLYNMSLVSNTTPDQHPATAVLTVRISDNHADFYDGAQGTLQFTYPGPATLIPPGYVVNVDQVNMRLSMVALSSGSVTWSMQLVNSNG